MKSNRCWPGEGQVILTNGRSPFGCLLNMTGGYPILWAGVKWKSTEALYQASRFTDEAIQKQIRDADNGWDAKQVAKRYIDKTRPNWYDVRVPVMGQCCMLKRDQHTAVADALFETGDRFIIEQSRSDDFWGAIPTPIGSKLHLTGENKLGCIWMYLRLGGLLIAPPNTLPGATLDEFYA